MNPDNIRQRVEAEEAKRLHPRAARGAESKGRAVPEDKCTVRTDFQRDRDRIIHSKSFRRLKGKTQVFFSPIGDHFRTRLTHTLEVSQIARTIARALGLNEDLTEAIALGHDLGHTPFGHTGEHVLDKLAPGGFHHARQSLRVVDVLEKDGRGLNLCRETRNGILYHTKGTGPIQSEGLDDEPDTLEGEIVRFSDVIAYVNHDIDDAMRAKVLEPSRVPAKIFDTLGDSHSKRITSLVLAILRRTDLDSMDHIRMEEGCLQAMGDLRSFLFDHVYVHPDRKKELEKAQTMLELMWDYFSADRERLRPFVEDQVPGGREIRLQDVTDFIAGMTDAYAIEIYGQLFLPRRWYI
ncbi:MAG: deoxyguanosinetriphosphate triphosphohydrolase [Pseudomonadota bacterium]